MSIFQDFEAAFLKPMSTGLNASLRTIPIELEFYNVLPALYGILRLRRRLGNMRLLAIALVSLLLLCVAAKFLRVGTGGNYMSPVFPLPLAGLIVSLAMSAPQLSDRILRHHDVSYGLYLYHMLVINLLVGLAAPAGWPSFAVAIIVSLGLAALSWTLIEKPYLRGKRGALRAVSDGTPITSPPAGVR